jgi:hypothetical protein
MAERLHRRRTREVRGQRELAPTRALEQRNAALDLLLSGGLRDLEYET